MLKHKSRKNIYYANTNQKKAGVVIILSKKCVSQNILKYITGNKDNYFI